MICAQFGCAKTLLALDSASRWLAAAAGSLVSPRLARPARTLRRLLAELPGM